MIELVYQEELVEEEIDIEKKYTFPSEIVEREHDGKKLIIYTEGVCWLVLNDIEEYKIYNALKEGKTIGEVLEQYDEETVSNVIVQIEAKHFENPIVNVREEKKIYIYLTNNCNERCRHCYMYAGEIKIEELSVEEWKTILFDFKNHGGEGVTFTGGEPSVYYGFDDIIEYAFDIGLSITVLSNGIGWSEERVQRLASKIDEIQISVDGYDAASYYSVRQYDGFEKALSTVKRFADQGTRISVAVTPLFDDIDVFIDQFEPLAKDLLECYPQLYIKFNLELLEGREVHVNEKDNRVYRRKMRQLVERLYPGYYEETFHLNYDNNCIMNNCGFGEISISSNGDVFWCNRIHELKSVYNIKSIGFEKLFEKSNIVRSKTCVDNSVTCKMCDVKYICGGGCRMDYPEIIDVDTKEGMWENFCDPETKKTLYSKMINSNEYFYSE